VTLDTWVAGRDRIWDLAFLPGGLPVYTENDSGQILARWSNDDTARPLGSVGQFDGAFDPSGEGGLMGIAVSPSFNGITDNTLLVCYSTSADNRIARFQVNFNAPPNAMISSWTPIVTGIPHATIHNGCRLRFQPGTGALFVTTGDGTSATAPQSPTSLGGKVLRIDENGAPWPGNASGARWYTRGHRNPQGIAFRPGSNEPYSVEHGPDVNDEVNHLRNGANSGWNPDNGAGVYDQSRPMTDGSLDANTMSPVWQSGGETVAPSGATFLSGPQWKSFDGALVVACLDGTASVGQRLLVMHLDGAGNALTSAPVATHARGIRLRAAVQGPDGMLYVVTDGSQIWKIVPA
jgi:glucose/arabinose dehydrogenase